MTRLSTSVPVPVTVVEFVTTRDVEVEFRDGSWATARKRPPGSGWQVADDTRERHTRWRRIVPAWIEADRPRP